MTYSSQSSISSPYYLEAFYHWEAASAEQLFVREFTGEEWKEYSWREFGAETRSMAGALQKRYQNVADKRAIILSDSCAHWYFSDIAAQLAGFTVGGLLTTMLPEQVKHCFEVMDAQVLFLGAAENWDAVRHVVPDNIDVISLPSIDGPVGSISWDSFCSTALPLKGRVLPSFDDPAVVIFTSGTTGFPKAVMHSVRTASGIYGVFAKNKDIGASRHISYMPMGHGAERCTFGYQLITNGGQITISRGREHFAEDMEIADVDWFVAPPRLWTKFQKHFTAELAGGEKPTVVEGDVMPNLELGKKIRKALHLENAKFLGTGTAPIPKIIQQWYANAGMVICDMYGQTECTPITLNTPSVYRLGSVGKVVDGAEVRLSSKGEILARSSSVMLGYLGDPDAMAEALVDGWVHTGDVGWLDKDGFYYIVGRIKDYFKTAKGKYVAPMPIEFAFAHSDMLDQQLLCGRGLSKTVLLVVLSELGERATKEEVNNELAALAYVINPTLEKHERVGLFVICHAPWTTENRLLTPTQKMVRSAIENKYSHLASLVDETDKEFDVVWESSCVDSCRQIENSLC